MTPARTGSIREYTISKRTEDAAKYNDELAARPDGQQAKIDAFPRPGGCEHPKSRRSSTSHRPPATPAAAHALSHLPSHRGA